MAKTAKSRKPYKRLPGRVLFSIIGISSLWLGADHFLMMTTSGPVENYKRFYFRDVQALLIQPNKRRLWFAVGYGVLLLFFLALAAWSLFMIFHKPEAAASGGWKINFDNPNAKATPPSVEGWKVALWWECSFAALFFIALSINQLLGRSCKLLVQTAAQTECLAPIKRIRTARKLLAILTPKIEAGQQEESMVHS